MKELSEIERELEIVEMHLRIVWGKDERRQLWKGYRDALLWVLGREIAQHVDSVDGRYPIFTELMGRLKEEIDADIQPK